MTDNIRIGDFIRDRDLSQVCGNVVSEGTLGRYKWPVYLVRLASGELTMIAVDDAIRLGGDRPQD